MASYGYGLPAQRRLEDFMPPKPKLTGLEGRAPAPLPEDFAERAGSTADRGEWFELKRLLQPHREQRHGALQAALYGNPLAGTFDTETSSGKPGLGGRLWKGVRSVTGRDDRIAMAKIAAFVGLASAAGAASGAGAAGGAGGGAGAGAGGAAGAGAAEGSAGFLPNVWAGSAGAAGAGGGAAAGGGLTAGQLAAAGVDPFLAGGGLSAGGAAAAAGGGGSVAATGSVPWYETTLGKTGIKLGTNLAANQFLGGKTTEERDLSRLSRAPYESGDIQKFLPPELRAGAIGPALESGMGGIAELLRNPGGLSPTVSDAIRQRLASESESIAQNFRGIGSNQQGAAARGNQPMSIKGALQSALDVAQERAQRGARREALQDSESLRREDLGQAFKILDAILQFISSGRGQSIPGLATAANQSGNRQAAQLASIASLLSSGASDKDED